MLVLTLFLTVFSVLQYLFKLFLFLLAYDFIFLKFLLLIILIFIMQYIYLYPYKKRLKLSSLRKLKYESYIKYKISDHNELDISICIIFLYFLFFIILLFISKLKNIPKNINSKQYFKIIYTYFENTNYLNLIKYFYFFIIEQFVIIIKSNISQSIE